jgi:hypothetical protein
MTSEATVRTPVRAGHETRLTANVVLVLAGLALAFVANLLNDDSATWGDGKLFLLGAGLAFAASLLLGIAAAVQELRHFENASSTHPLSLHLRYGQLTIFALGVLLLVIFFSIAFVF